MCFYLLTGRRSFCSNTSLASVDLITCVHFSLHRDIPEQQKPEGQHEDDEWWVYVAPFVAIGPMTASIGHTSAFSPNDVLAMAKHPRCLQCNLLAYLPDSYKKWVPVEEVEGTCKIVSVDAQDSGNEDAKGVKTHGVFVGRISQEGDSNPTFEKVNCCSKCLLQCDLCLLTRQKRGIGMGCFTVEGTTIYPIPSPLSTRLRHSSPALS